MEITVATIFSTANVARAIAEYMGLIDSLEVRINRITSSKLNTALRELKHGQNASSPDTEKSALQSARSYFSEALSLESREERLASAYIGLGMCFMQLNETENCKNTLIEFSNQPFKNDKVQGLQVNVQTVTRKKAGNPYINWATGEISEILLRGKREEEEEKERQKAEQRRAKQRETDRRIDELHRVRQERERNWIILGGLLFTLIPIVALLSFFLGLP